VPTEKEVTQYWTGVIFLLVCLFNLQSLVGSSEDPFKIKIILLEKVTMEIRLCKKNDSDFLGKKL
jgi:hypothetical protein